MERLRKPAKEIEAQHHTLEEVAALLREGPATIFNEASRNKLANSLQELSRYRAAAYVIRVSLAQVDKGGACRYDAQAMIIDKTLGR